MVKPLSAMYASADLELNSILEWVGVITVSSSSTYLVQVSGSVLWFLNFIWVNTAAARGAPRHDQRSLSGVYDTYVLERCMSESEDIAIDILERWRG